MGTTCSRRRLAIIVETNNDTESFVYSHPQQIRVTSMGPSPTKVNHMPASVVQIQTQDGVNVRARIAGGFAEAFAAWAAQAASA